MSANRSRIPAGIFVDLRVFGSNITSVPIMVAHNSPVSVLCIRWVKVTLLLPILVKPAVITNKDPAVISVR